jgi:PAS domain S-box-containing protein
MNTEDPVLWMQRLTHVSPVGIFLCAASGGVIYVNQKWCTLTGLTQPQAMGRGWEHAIHPDDLPRVREEWNSMISRGERFNSDYRFRRPDGDVVWVHTEIAPDSDESGQATGYIGCVTDVTELHHVREDLLQAHQQLEDRIRERTQQWREMAMIIEQMEDAVIWSDLAGRIVGWNNGAEKMLGYNRGDVIGGSTLAITPADEQGSAIEVKRRVRLGESVHHREVVRVAKDGRRIPVLLSVFPLRNEAGSIIGSAAILRDRTDQRRAESRMRQLSQRLLGAQDEERRRIARELHDSTAQLLVALSINMNRLRADPAVMASPGNSQLMAESFQLVERATLELRTQSYLLHPPLLEERGVTAALRFFIDGFTERSGINVEFRAARQIGRLDPLVELTLFRIVQEALGNVHRHSQSPAAEVVVALEGGSVALQVRDFGCGLPADPGELRGVGIAGMRERVAQLGGSFGLEPAQPGVKLIVTLPLEPRS